MQYTFWNAGVSILLSFPRRRWSDISESSKIKGLLDPRLRGDDVVSISGLALMQ
jgi:hypothetical protein